MTPTPTLTRLLADLWGLLRREGDLILRVGAPFLFLSTFAIQLLCDPLPAAPASLGDDAAVAAWLQAMSAWGERGNALAYFAAAITQWFGLAALAVLLADPARPDVAATLARTVRLFPRLALASLLCALPVNFAMLLLVLPGLYVQARLIAVLPALAAEQPLGAAASLGRSWRMTRGAGWAILGALVTLFLLQWLMVVPLAPVEAWLRRPGHVNPFVLALVDAGIAAAIAAYQTAGLLLGVVIYRRRASIGT